jgi:hypothetical protein
MRAGEVVGMSPKPNTVQPQGSDLAGTEVQHSRQPALQSQDTSHIDKQAAHKVYKLPRTQTLTRFSASPRYH